MTLNEIRNKVYNFFDTELKPIILQYGASDETMIKCNEKIATIQLTLNWIVRIYGDTVRVSAHSPGIGYQFFMIATPDGSEEYDFGIIYHGSRKEHNENSSDD